MKLLRLFFKGWKLALSEKEILFFIAVYIVGMVVVVVMCATFDFCT